MRGSNQSTNIIYGIAPIIAIFLAYRMVVDPTGSFGFVVKFFGLGCILLALFVPRTGIYLLAIQAAYLDLLKRMAYVYGAGGNWIVVQILAIPLLTLAALIVGTFWKGITSPQGIKMNTLKLFIAAGVFCLCSFSISYLQTKFPLEAFRAMGYGAFFSFIAPVATVIYADRNDLLKDLRWICLLFLPVALYGMKQAFFGFSAFEWSYAEGGFSISGQQMFGEVARPFSTLSSVEGYGCMAFFWLFSIWHCFQYRTLRLLFIACSLIFGVACISSLGRTAIICFPIAIAAYFLIRSKLSLVVLYGTAITGLLFMILFSDTMIQFTTWTGEFTGDLSGKARRLTTLSTTYERIYGIGQLDDPDRWSWFGKPLEELEKYPAHDHISHLLLRTGAVGLFTTLIAIAFGAYKFHKRYLQIVDKEIRSMVGICIAFWIPFTVIGFMGGLGLDTSPYNFLFWYYIGGILLLYQREDILLHEQSQEPTVEAKPAFLPGSVRNIAVNNGQGILRPNR